MNIIIMILYIALPLIALIILYNRHTIQEDHFMLKWLGYYILGAFFLKINQFMIPLGFLIYLLFLRGPKQNKSLKRNASLLGLLFFVVLFTTPFIEQKWFERTHEIQIEVDNLYEFSFQEVGEKIAQEFDISPNNMKLNSFEIEYESDGKISGMEFEMVDQLNQQFILYKMKYHPNDQMFRIKRSRMDSWLQYNRLMNASSYFESLDSFSIEKLTEKYNFSSYQLEGSGEKGSYAVQNWENYVIEHDGSVKKIENYELPIDGFLLRLHTKNGEYSGTSHLAAYYFYASYHPKEDGPYTVQDAVAVLRGDKRVYSWMEAHYGEGTRKQENGSFYLKIQGKWQKVSEEEYQTKVEPFHRKEELINQEWHITYEAKFGDLPYILTGVVSRETGEIITVETK